MKILALSGWGQPYNALAGILPTATHFDYAQYTSVPEALSAIAEAGREHDAVVGWSLGGQLAVRAIAAGMLKPASLTLIAAPFQFVESDTLKLGMKRDAFEKFRDNYQRNPTRTMDKAWELVIKDDTRAGHIRTYMQGYNKSKVLAKDWLGWLHRLDGFSVAGLHLADFPPTLLVHGSEDVVVEATQSHQFAQYVPHAKHVEWKDCGHAPHWHDEEALKKIIAEHMSV